MSGLYLWIIIFIAKDLEFIKNYPNVTENEILTATTNYINAKKREQFAYTKTLGLFIYDDNGEKTEYIKKLYKIYE